MEYEPPIPTTYTPTPQNQLTKTHLHVCRILSGGSYLLSNEPGGARCKFYEGTPGTIVCPGDALGLHPPQEATHDA